MNVETSEIPKAKPIRTFTKVFFLLLLFLITTISLWFYSATKTLEYGTPYSFTIDPGATVQEIAKSAADQGLIKSELLLYATLVYRYDPKKIQAGTYTINSPLSVFALSTLLATSVGQEDTVRMTFPEGITIEQMSEIAQMALPNFDPAQYIEITSEKEGYLLPETYFVPVTFTASDLVSLQERSLTTLINELSTNEQGFTIHEILTLASILEREANSSTSMRMVSGILQNRLNEGMALQADATIEYVLETPLNELGEGVLAVQLREVDSPYNTYKNTGLPPTPIGNPGRTAIEAVLDPTPSDFFFYITDPSGEFHYATTYNKHLENIAKYLR